MQFCDRLTIDRSHRTKDGYLRVVAKGARSGIQQYRGREIDPEGAHFTADQVVNVYRPPEEVFSTDTMASFVGRPITDDHPSVAVTAKNWRDHSRGVVGGAVKDGEWIRFDLALMDAELVAKVDGGKRELSCGYTCDISIEDGTAPDGTAYQAVQRSIAGNHLAVVNAARAGSEARIADGGKPLFQICDTAAVILSVPDALEEPPVSKFITLDGLKVDLSDAEAVQAAITKLQGVATGAQTRLAAAETQIATLTTDKATLEAKVTTLEAKVADAAITPAKLRDAAKAYALVVGKAKALGVAVADDADEAAIMQAVVTAKVGDAAKDWNETQVAASFATLTADVKADDQKVFGFDAKPSGGEADKAVKDAYLEMVADLTGAKQAA